MAESTQSPLAAALLDRCPNCHAALEYSASTQKTTCAYCGHAAAVPARAGAVEHAISDGLALDRPLDFGVELRRKQCGECGATVSFEGASVATRCEFCGSSRVLERKDLRRVLRPESLLPFGVEREVAAKKFKGWLSKLWFRPNDLRALASLQEMNGVYVPFWTFDAQVASRWEAESGTYYYENQTVYRNGQAQTERVQKTRWQWAHGQRQDTFDDLLVCGSKGVPPALSEKLVTFDTRALVAYDPRFLLGWKAEEYGLDLRDAYQRALERMQQMQRSRCAGDVPGDTHRNLEVQNEFTHETFKLVLLPVWISAYRYREKVFRFLVNGQTGEVTGTAPWSWVKITFAVIVALLAAAVIAVIAQQR